jgi:tRNA(His) 5'-end guanylyltransferase
LTPFIQKPNLNDTGANLNGLQAEKESFLAQECAVALQQNPEGFQKGILQTREFLAGLYTTRLRINKSLKRNFFENEEISSWENAMKQLSNSSAEEVLLNSVMTEEKVTRCFGIQQQTN